jgi:phosphatidylinositol phosphate synthase
MLNALRPLFAKLLTPLGQALARTPVTPNMVTVAGTLGVAAGALWLFPTGHLFAGTLVCWGFAMFDMLDGLLARVKGSSGPWGAFLDSTLDRVGDAAVFSGLAIYLARGGGGHQWGLAGVALYCLVAGNMVSYARARAEGLGVKANVGVAERSERLLVALVAAGLTGLGVPFVLAIGLWAVALGSTVTFGQRVWVVRKAVGPGSGEPGAEQERERS